MPDAKQEEAGQTKGKDLPHRYAAVHVSKGSVVPDGAIRMTRDEVIDMHYKILRDWQPQSDVWPFKFGTSMVAGVAALSGIAVNTHFRNKFALGRYGTIQTYLPAVIFPALYAAATQIFMRKSVITEQECPSCVCIRGGVFQSISVAYSVILAAPMCIKISRHYHTYVLTKNNFQPNIIHALKTRPLAWYCFLGLLVSNFATGYYVTHLQGATLEKITMKEAKKVVDNLVWK